MIMMYFVSIGGAADLMELLQVGGVILCAMVFVTVGNLGCLFGFGKLFKWNWEGAVQCVVRYDWRPDDCGGILNQ